MVAAIYELAESMNSQTIVMNIVIRGGLGPPFVFCGPSAAPNFRVSFVGHCELKICEHGCCCLMNFGVAFQMGFGMVLGLFSMLF